jgi:phosphorylcholine metabolism protein LicD
MILAGLPIEKTSDLDLFVSHEDADQLKSVWADRIIENYSPSDTNLFMSNFGRFDFGELDVEVMGGLKVFRDNEWKSLQIEKFIEVSLGKQKIKIPTLEEQRRILYFFGREKDLLKAQLIESHLSD